MSEYAVSLVRGDLLFRLHRRFGLVPAEGLGLARRALFWALVAWAPIAAWAFYMGRAGPPLASEPLLAHFGVQARCLIAIPLLILAEGQTHAVTMRVLPHFIRSGLVPESEVPAFRAALNRLTKMRDSILPWVLIVGVVLALNTVAQEVQRSHEVLWGGAAADDTSRLGFGPIWYLYVARPIHLALLAAWLWRIVLMTVLFRNLAKLNLALVPTHPDKAGGLGFLSSVPKIFAPVVLALGTVMAARWAHDVLYHDVHVKDLRLQMGAFVVTSVLLFSLPLFAFIPLMAKTKRLALLDYGALVGRHGRLVKDRWIGGQAVEDDGLLSAPELGPVADMGTAYTAVAAMQVLLIGKESLVPLMVAAAIPLIAVLAIEVPIAEILKALAKAVI